MFDQFADEELWHYGPCFEMILVLDPQCDIKNVDDFFRKSEKLTSYKKPKDTVLDRFIFNYASDKYIGMELSFYISKNSEHKRAGNQAVYTLIIRPPQLRKLLLGELESSLDLSQKKSLALLTKGLMQFIPDMQKLAKLRYATIATEMDGFANVRTNFPDGLYFSEILANHLNIDGTRYSPYLTLVAPNFEQLDELVAMMPN